MTQVNIHEAKTQLSKLIQRALDGEDVIIARVSTLPFHHRDPFDRMLIAQAMTEDLVILSRDAAIGEYPVTRIW